MGAMVEHGITQKYLNEYCDTKPYQLCAYKDSLPDRAYQFIWDEKSPFYKIGGWKKTKTEFNEIIFGTLTQPKYIAIHIKESCKATLHQLTLFSIGDGNGSFLEGTLLYERVAKYFSHDLATYSSSKQNQSQLDFLNMTNSLFLIILVLSLFYLIFLFTKYKNSINNTTKTIAILFFIGILLNAWDCGTFANAIDRLGCKMIWLIPFMTTLILSKIILYKKVKEV
jgi:hypothetical protein